MESLKRAAAVFLLAAFLFGFILPAGARAESAPRIYAVKLQAGYGPDLLKSFGKNIERRFVNMSGVSGEFSNIYTFDSEYRLETLNAGLRGKIQYIQPVSMLESSQAYLNDPAFTANIMDIDKQWGLVKAGFDKAWEKTAGSFQNTVAVIDTGIDQTHADLKSGSYATGFDFISRQEIATGSNSDDNGHGTLVAGVLGATANNAQGIVGTNWQIVLMPLKALDSSGKGDAVTVAEAIVWAADHGASIVNLSVGGIGFGHDTALANAVSYAFAKNVLLVAAAGNDISSTGSNLDQNPVFPICDDNNYNMVIGVAATDQNDLKPEFSNYGRNCIDVAAPGKRILSAINYDPLTKKPSPNSYAYASGTSLAVPFVAGQAALIRALYPFASNVQIRDRIISTADPIDNLNLTQCGGNSCRGLLGAGRINVPKSLEKAITRNFSEGDLVRNDLTGAIYLISGGQKRLVSPFVFNQRFAGATIKSIGVSELAALPEGSYVTPADGTLVKLDGSPAVYRIFNGQKLPVTAQIFTHLGLRFSEVNTVSYSELNSWPTGSFLAPKDGTLVKAHKNKTVYWAVGQALHPISYEFYKDRGLSIFPIMLIPDKDISNFAKGEPYFR